MELIHNLILKCRLRFAFSTLPFMVVYAIYIAHLVSCLSIPSIDFSSVYPSSITIDSVDFLAIFASW